MFDLAGKKVFVAGHRGMVGGAITRRLRSENCHVLTASRAELDLTDQVAVKAWFASHRPDAVILAAAKVGGILANSQFPVEFLRDNLLIQTNVIDAAHQVDVSKLMFLGSSCIYPKFASQPISEDALLAGPLEPTNEPYAIAKIAGIKLARAYRQQFGRDFISVMPTNLYGVGDNYDLNSSHVLPALIRKAHQAKLDAADSFEVWGSGEPRREFLDADDLADACIFLMKTYSADQHINVGTGSDISIRDLAVLVAGVVGFEGSIVFDREKPDGTPRKLMDSTRLFNLGWRPQTTLEDGIVKAYREFLDRQLSTTVATLGNG